MKDDEAKNQMQAEIKVLSQQNVTLRMEMQRQNRALDAAESEKGKMQAELEMSSAGEGEGLEGVLLLVCQVEITLRSCQRASLSLFGKHQTQLGVLLRVCVCVLVCESWYCYSFNCISR